MIRQKQKSSRRQGRRSIAASKRATRFAGQDVNEDGLLTEDEVSNRLWEKISVADTNDDSGVSLEEFEIWMVEQASETPAPDGSPVNQGVADRDFAQIGRRFDRARR